MSNLVFCRVISQKPKVGARCFAPSFPAAKQMSTQRMSIMLAKLHFSRTEKNSPEKASISRFSIGVSTVAFIPYPVNERKLIIA